jgi:hypothetical protein
MTLLAALGGAAVTGGLVLLILELTRRVPLPGRPAPQALRRLSAKARRRAAAAVVIGLIVLAISRRRADAEARLHQQPAAADGDARGP